VPKDKKVLQHCQPLTKIKYFRSGLCLILGWKRGGGQSESKGSGTVVHCGHKKQNKTNGPRIFTMLDTPVPIRTLKLRNIGPGYYLNGRPFREFQVLLAPIPLPPPPCGQSTVFSDSLCLSQVIETH
jgi:hypothetical protein